MKNLLFLLLIAFSCTQRSLPTSQREPYTIVVPDSMQRLQKLAVDDFVKTVGKSCGCTVPVVPESRAGTLAQSTPQIIVGPSRLTAQLGYADDLKTEEFRIVSDGKGRVVVLAKDLINTTSKGNIWKDAESEHSRVTQWALGHLLDRYWGVRWLWPGELGTFIPQKKTVSIPAFDYRYQPALEKRNFNIVRGNPENELWIGYNHFGGGRVNYHFQHSFRKSTDNGDWMAEFFDSRPDLLAQSPAGKPEKPRREGFYKICTSNPGGIAEIVRRWERAGMPDFWDITPNDGKGYCTCDRCMNQDRTLGGVDYPKQDVWEGKDYVNISDRHVWQWNEVVRQMRTKRPDAKVGVYYYSQYKQPPKSLKVEPGVVGEMVHSFDFGQWLAWQRAGANAIGLRPNWLYMGASGPHLPLREIGSYIEQARKNGMILINMDSFQEYWATQGLNYYLIGRLVSRPDLNTAQIIDEYCAAFTGSAPEIRAYIQFWEDYHRQVNYNIPAGGNVWRDGPSLYKEVCMKEFGELMHPLQGHWKSLPYIYNETILTQADKLLDRATAKAADAITKQRIDFLRDGLTMVRKGAAYMAAHKAKDEAAKKRTFDDHIAFNKAMRAKHGYWNATDIFHMRYWGLIGKEYDASDM